jgi:hypothetical protein
MEISWYRFVRPDGVEFNFMGGKEGGKEPFSADSQGRVGVPGYGSTDYMEQFLMPMITAIVPAAVNLIAPISDKFVNQIDLDNNTVVQTGQMRSSELAKNEIITAWNSVAQKLMVDMMNNTVPPFSIAAGTRITVFSPTDLVVTCGEEKEGKACAVTSPSEDYAGYRPHAEDGKDGGLKLAGDGEGEEWIGQVRSFNLDSNLDKYCKKETGEVKMSAEDMRNAGLDYRTVSAFCKANMYKAVNIAKQEALHKNQQDPNNKNSIAAVGGIDSKDYNEKVLGLQYTDDGSIKNPFAKEKPPAAAPVLTCEDGTPPDSNGCCTGEVYTDMGEQGFNCCPSVGGDCFPPLV